MDRRRDPADADAAALDVSFKVFSREPRPGRQRIVAVPRELNQQLAPGRGESSFVLDADECAADAAEISERARFLVGQLATSTIPTTSSMPSSWPNRSARGCPGGPRGPADGLGHDPPGRSTTRSGRVVPVAVASQRGPTG